VKGEGEDATSGDRCCRRTSLRWEDGIWGWGAQLVRGSKRGSLVTKSLRPPAAAAAWVCELAAAVGLPRSWQKTVVTGLGWSATSEKAVDGVGSEGERR